MSSAGGQVEFQVSNGSSRMLALEAGRPLRFNALQGAVEIDRQALKVLPSKFKAENRIYLMSGTISLANKQAKLKVSTSGTQWEITGALEKAADHAATADRPGGVPHGQNDLQNFPNRIAGGQRGLHS